MDDHLGTDTLVELVEGRATPGDRTRIEAHASRCAECRAMLSSLARGSQHPFTPSGSGEVAEAPVRVGRYVIVRRLGAGGMGVVYAARDPELDRTIAVKLLRGADDAGMQERLKREAQAMAQLAHPHVVAVHDVGTHDDRIFVAMEFVEGETLATWCSGRTQAEIIAAYCDAGRGLAAAHAAGIIHRDFKPENVLVGKDGRVRVGDFGLASASGGRVQAAPPASPVEPDGPTIPASGGSTNTLVGTPYYIAPELVRGGVADVRSDEFSFCVALYTALYGERPFAGDTLDELADAAEAGRLREPARRGDKRVWAAVARGLAAKPDDRFASLDELVLALAPSPRRRRVPWVAVAAIGGVALAGAGVAFAVRATRTEPCGEGSLAGAWDPPRIAAAGASLAGTPVPYAARTWQEVSTTLDRYAHDWHAMHVGACEATRRAEQTEDMLDLRMTCLDERRQRLAALVTTFTANDPLVTQHAVEAVHVLPPIALCADLVALKSAVRPPTPEIAKQVEQLRAELATVAAQRDSGLSKQANDAIGPVLAKIRALGYRPLEGDALGLHGLILRDIEDFAASRGAYEQALLAAEAGRDDRAVARTLVDLIPVVGRGLGKLDEVAPLRARAVALLERIDHPPQLEAKLQEVMGEHELETGKLADAELDLRAALRAWEQLYGRNDIHVVPVLRSLAHLDMLREHGKDARAELDRVLAVQRAMYGDDHPDVAYTIDMIAGAEQTIGHSEAAAKLYLQAKAIYERSLGPDSISVANVEDNLASTYEWLDKVDEAIRLHRHAIDIVTKRLGPTHPTTLSYRSALAVALDDNDRSDEALAILDDVLAKQRATLGTHQATAFTLEALANVELGAKKYAAARDHALEAQRMFEATLGEAYNPHAELRTLGEAYLELGDAARAVDLLEDALKRTDDTADPGVVAWTDAQLGRALIESHRDVARGRTLVLDAWPKLAHDDRMSFQANQLRGWLRAHHML